MGEVDSRANAVEPRDTPVVADKQHHDAPPEIKLGPATVASLPFGEVAGALSKAQASYTGLAAAREAKVRGQTKNGQWYDYTYHYADLADALRACLPALTAEGLAVLQAPTTINGREVSVTTVLMHSSGQYVRHHMSLTAEAASPQKVGAASTYARRYSLLALVGLAPEDGDAEETPRKPKRKAPVAKNDELAAEMAAITKDLAAAKTTAALSSIMGRINALPTEEKMTFREPYQQRLAAIKGAG